MRVALMHVPSRAVAEEVVGDTWLGVIKGIDRFEGRSALRTWIFQILLNNARTRGKREKRTLPFASLRRRAEEGGDEPAVDADRFQGSGERGRLGAAAGEWEGVDAQIESDETRRVLLDAIAALPPRQRDVIALRDIQGYSAEEARNALGVSETNQRVLLHRARSKVRAALEAAHGGRERMTCQELVELVTDYLEGRLPDATVAQLEAHLAACDGCTAYIEQMRLTLRRSGGSPRKRVRRQLATS